jgi:hypothetical protein
MHMVTWALFPLLMVSLTDAFYVHYFAFGSNMNPDLLERRTFSTPGSLTFQRVILDDYQLVFNTGLDTFGMAASVEPNRSSITHGLLYKLSLPQFNFLLASEGWPVGYQIESVKVRPYSGEKSISASTLRSGRGLISGKPSERYIKLLQKGAKENNLDEQYQSYLQNIEPISSAISRLRT